MNESIDTNQFGAILKRPPDSIRTSLCRDGSVNGVKPVKNPVTGRLEWPLLEVLKARDRSQS
jgi:hypothetical protein